MDQSVKKTVIVAASVVAAAAAGAVAWWWHTRRQVEKVLLGLPNGTGNISTGIVQEVIDTTNEIMGRSYFTVSELTRSATATARGINNTPSPAVRSKLQALITECLDPIRRIYGRPIIVSSGYRCPELNAAVGGVANSQHTTGEAADLVPASGGSLAGIFRAAVQFGGFDQLIIERRGASKWVHVSYGPRMRHAILAYNNGSYTNITTSWESYIANFA